MICQICKKGFLDEFMYKIKYCQECFSIYNFSYDINTLDTKEYPIYDEEDDIVYITDKQTCDYLLLKSKFKNNTYSHISLRDILFKTSNPEKLLEKVLEFANDDTIICIELNFNIKDIFCHIEKYLGDLMITNYTYISFRGFEAMFNKLKLSIIDFRVDTIYIKKSGNTQTFPFNYTYSSVDDFFHCIENESDLTIHSVDKYKKKIEIYKNYIKKIILTYEIEDREVVFDYRIKDFAEYLGRKDNVINSDIFEFLPDVVYLLFSAKNIIYRNYGSNIVVIRV